MPHESWIFSFREQKQNENLIYFPFSAKNNILYIFYVSHNATLKSTNTTQYERDLIMFNFILILFSQPLKINWLFFSIYWMLSITPSDWIMITTIPIVLVKWMEGDRMEWRKRNNFFRLWMEKRRLFSHFGSAIINFIVRTFFSSCTEVGLLDESKSFLYDYRYNIITVRHI